MQTTPAQLHEVLHAADDLLTARRHQTVTVGVWVALARSVAACTGRRTIDLLTPRDLADAARCGLAWDEATDGMLPPYQKP